MNAAAAVVLPSCGNGILNLSTSLFTKSNFSLSFLLQKEITDGPLLFTRPVLQSTLWSIKCEGNNRRGRPQRNTSSSRTDKEHEYPFDNKSSSSNQEEILGLFKRIQSSIAKEGSRTIRKRTADNSKDAKSTETVLDVLRQSRKQIDEEKKKKVLPRRQGSRKKEKGKEHSPALDFKPARLPSNFMKRSPIPTPSTPKVEDDEEVTTEGILPAVMKDKMLLHALEKMKLPELKEFAKSRGVKGYSKMKKAELVELLKEFLKS